MEQAGLLSFPVETLHHLSRYLSGKDLLTLSATCHYLRDVFNDNSVWKRFIPESVTSLENQHQLVEPKFQYEDGPTPLCENRAHYMRKIHLLKNWKNGNFVKRSSKVGFYYASGVHNVPKGKNQVVYKENYIFLGRFVNDIESDAIEVWDISKEPVLHSLLEMKNVNYVCFYVMGMFLVVVECRKVNVYQITIPDKQFPLVFSFIITESEVSHNKESEHPGRCNYQCVGWSHYSVDQYLVSNKCGEEGSTFHVWDILNSRKYGVFVMPVEGFSVSLFSNSSDTWVLRQRLQSNNNQVFSLFNVKEKTFSGSVFNFKGYAYHMIFFSCHVIVFVNVETPNSEGWYNSICTLYDFNTSRQVKKRVFNHARKNYRIKTTRVVNGKFIILCVDCFHIVDALTLETVDHFQCGFDVCYITHQFNIFDSVFVVACHRDNLLYVWDIKNKQKLSRSLEVVSSSHLYPNNAYSKMVTFDYYKMNVLHFW